MKVNGHSLTAHLSHRQNFPYGIRELRASQAPPWSFLTSPVLQWSQTQWDPPRIPQQSPPGLVSFLKLYQSPNPWQPSLWKPAWLRGQRTSKSLCTTIHSIAQHLSDRVADVACVHEWGEAGGVSYTSILFKAWKTTAPPKGNRAEESLLLSTHFEATAGGASNQISQRKKHQKIYSICISWVAFHLEISFIWQLLQSRLNFEGGPFRFVLASLSRHWVISILTFTRSRSGDLGSETGPACSSSKSWEMWGIFF